MDRDFADLLHYNRAGMVLAGVSLFLLLATAATIATLIALGHDRFTE